MGEKKTTFRGTGDMPLSAISENDMRWNKTGSWRNVRPYYDSKTSPCIAGCPAGEDIQGYIELAKAGRYEDAVRLIWEHNPFPAVCGRVCDHPCMQRCLRGDFDDAVFIPAIERFLGDYAIAASLTYKPPAKRRGESVAIIGGGPAGLSCAYFLARDGFRVTIFEAKNELGGVLRFGIPPYRLPKDVLDAELDRLLDLGVELEPNTIVGQDVTIDKLPNFSAYFIATGLQRSRTLGLENEDADGVLAGLDFLEAVNCGQTPDLGRHVVVIGGGNTAMDVARSALRLGAEVTVVYRRTRDEMPAIEDEIRDALEEGVQFRFLAAPAAILAPEGTLKTIHCQEMVLGEVDESGRRRPVPKDGALFELSADTLLVAVGESADSERFQPIFEVSNGLIVTDEFGRTSNKKFFAGGDVVSGASTVVNAIARGRGAAQVVCAELTGGTFNPRTEKKLVAIADLNTSYFYHKMRQPTQKVGLRFGSPSFAETNLGLTPGQIRSELDRCFSCGVCDACDNCWVFCPDVAIHRENNAYTIDYDYCKGCLICVEECPRGVLSSVREGGTM